MAATEQSLTPLAQARIRLLGRLQRARVQIEAEILSHLSLIGEAQASADPTYQSERPAVISAAVDYCLSAFAAETYQSDAPIPAVLIEQIRRAARSGLGSETLAERLMAASALFSQHVAAEARADEHPEWAELVFQLRARQDEIHKRFAEALFLHYRAERERLERSHAERRLELVRRLLAGEAVDTTPLRYDFDSDAQHLGLIATGPGAERLVGATAARLGLGALCVQREDDLLWGWLGARRELPMASIVERLASEVAEGLAFVIGEPATGIEGWRATHELALHGTLVAKAQGAGITHCAEVQIEAALLASPALAHSLCRRWLSPLEQLPFGAQAARKLLRAYFACERKVSCVAECLGNSRQTIDRRLALIEQVLGGRLASCLAELELALRIESLLNEGESGETLSSEIA